MRTSFRTLGISTSSGGDDDGDVPPCSGACFAHWCAPSSFFPWVPLGWQSLPVIFADVHPCVCVHGDSRSSLLGHLILVSSCGSSHGVLVVLCVCRILFYGFTFLHLTGSSASFWCRLGVPSVRFRTIPCPSSYVEFLWTLLCCGSAALLARLLFVV